MLRSFLMGLVGGQRAMTPLAVVANAAARGRLAVDDTMLLKPLASPLAATAATLLAIGEMAGDKQKTAPDRIVPIGLIARFATSAIAGAALSPKRRLLGAAVGGVTAVVASYPGWRLRMAALARYGQDVTGFVEDAVVLTAAATIVRAK